MENLKSKIENKIIKIHIFYKKSTRALAYMKKK